MNAMMAALFVTASCVALAYAAIQKGEKRESSRWIGSKWGLILYGLGTFAWSLKGLELGDYGLVLISALQTAAIFAGVILL